MTASLRCSAEVPYRRPATTVFLGLVGRMTILTLMAVGLTATASTNSPDHAQMVAWRERALALEHGEGVPRDIPEAIRLHCLGAKAGDAESQYSLGWIYANGRGVTRDDALAAYFFTLAAKAHDHEPSQRMLHLLGPPASEPPACMVDPPPVAKSDEWQLPPDTPEQTRQMIALIRHWAPKYGVSERLALAIARTESGFDPRAVSLKNAQGLMQLIPETAERFNVRRPFDPEQNVRGGLAYLRWLLSYYRGDVTLVAAAYNAGERAVDRYRGIPPYAETRAYVTRIKSAVPVDVHPYDHTVTQPSPELHRMRHAIRRVQG